MMYILFLIGFYCLLLTIQNVAYKEDLWAWHVFVGSIGVLFMLGILAMLVALIYFALGGAGLAAVGLVIIVIIGVIHDLMS